MQHYDTIILSPHLDDAALSCGGYIIEQTKKGKSTLIATFMAGDPPEKPLSLFAQQLHARWELAAQVVQERRKEDIEASHLLGADVFHDDIPDCIYRQSPEEAGYLYDSEEGLFGDMHAQDVATTLPKLVRTMAHLPSAKQIFSPLTIGHHVDHQLVRQAAELQFGNSLIYYEDYPYAQEVGALDTVIANDRLNWEYETTYLDRKTLARKADAIVAFKSQMSTFFNGRIDLMAQLQAYANQVGGERYWRHK